MVIIEIRADWQGTPRINQGSPVVGVGGRAARRRVHHPARQPVIILRGRCTVFHLGRISDVMEAPQLFEQARSNLIRESASLA